MKRSRRLRRTVVCVGLGLSIGLAAGSVGAQKRSAATTIAGFGSMAWGDPIAKLGPADALPLVERPGQPYEPCFRRLAESLDFQGVALSKITWCFYDGGLSYVSLASDQPTAFANLSTAFTALHGAPRSAGPSAAAWGAGPDSDPDGATASLFETKKVPGALLMMLSNRTKIRKAQAIEAAANAAAAASGPE